MLSAFSRAYQVTRDEKYEQVIRSNISFIDEKLLQEGRLKRTYKDGQAKYDAFIEDYAFLINALLDAYEALFDAEYINRAIDLINYANNHFLDDSGTAYCTISDQQPELIHRLKDIHDSSIPSGTGIMLLNNLRMFSLTEKESYYSIAEKIFKAHASDIQSNPYGYASYLNALDFFLEKPKEILIARNNSQKIDEYLDLVFKNYLPNKVVIVLSENEKYPALTASLFKGKKIVDGKITAYVCQDFQCSLPVFEEENLRKLLEE
jgi:uncharacterized protein YyaL (SSP411 family)